MSLLNVRLDPNSARSLILLTGSVEAQVNAAMRCAISRTAKWVNAQASQRLAKATKLSAKILNSRNQIYLNSDEGRVWIGLNPIDAKKLSPVQSASGVKAGPANFPGAFIVKGSGKLAGQVMKRGDHGRLPIKKQVYAIFDAANPVINEIAREVGTRLLMEFEHELKWTTRSQA